MPSITDQGVVIRVWDWSETSQTALIFAREHGLVRGLAKGSKRAKGAFSGGLELLTRGQLVAIPRPTSDLATLTAWDLQEIFPVLRRSLPAFYAGAYFCELVQHGVTDSDPHPALWDALLSALRGMDETREPGGVAWAVLGFQWSLLVETGYRPDLSVDIVSGTALEAGGVHAFVPRRGGFTRDRGGGSIDGEEVWRVRAETLAALRTADAGQTGAGLDAGVVHRGVKLLGQYVQHILGREMASMEAMSDALGGRMSGG